jgi:uncharacterized protein (TIGR02271 family)
MAFTDDDIARLTGATVLDLDGDTVGRIGQVYVDPAGAPSWATIRTGFLGSSEPFFPLEGAAFEGKDVRVPFSKDAVANSPRVESDEELSIEHADALVDHYASQGGRVTGGRGDGVPDGDPADSAPDAAMTRSEERLHVGTRTAERGRVRLRKHIVAEQQTITVPVSREEAVLVREPLTEADLAAAVAGRELSEEEHEIVLHGEIVMTVKDIVPVERIRLSTSRVTTEQQVTVDVRKEQIELTSPDGVTR